MGQSPASVIGLDIGTVRTGVARAGWPDGIASPLTTIASDENFLTQLIQIADSENVLLIVVGRPRGMSGQETSQTGYVDAQINNIKASLNLPVFIEDEAVTSVKAEAELKSRGKPYSKADVDALSATYILEDFLTQHPKGAGIEI